MPDLTLVVQGGADSVAALDLDTDAVAATLLEAADADPDRCVLCPPQVPPTLPKLVIDRLHRLIETRASAIATASPPVETGPTPGGIGAR
jgi:hypothetical protein